MKTLTGFVDVALSRGGNIRLGEGDSYTRGPWYFGPDFASLPEGSRLIGAGERLSKLYLLNPRRITGEKPRPDMRILHTRSGVDISDLSLVAPSKDDGQFYLVTAGIRGLLGSTRIRINRVSISNLVGSITPNPMDGLQHEAFGVSFDPGWGGHVVQDVTVDGEKDAYLSAFSGQATAKALVLFERCTASCEMGYAAFTLYDNMLVRDCTSSLFGYSVYNDTGSITNAAVEGGIFSSSRVAIGFVGETGTLKTNIRIRDARFNLMNIGAVGLELVSKGGAQFRNIDIVGCKFLNFSASRFTLFSSNAEPTNCGGITFRDCTFPSSTVTNARGVPFTLVDCRYDNGLRISTLPAIS